MSEKTAIEWTDATWNPIRGCSKVSEGCRNCYAETVAARFSGPGMPYAGLARNGRWTGEVRLIEEHLQDPLRWKRPRRVFVNSMSDLFHESLDPLVVGRIFNVMGAAKQHTFQILTKRPWRMLMLVRDYYETIGSEPFPNVWLGVSVEDQRTVDGRVPFLLQTPAAKRFVSGEPLLGQVILGPYLHERSQPCPDGLLGCAVLHHAKGLDWVIVGGESGPSARPCRIEWLRSIVRQARSAEIPVFVKQLGKVFYHEDAEIPVVYRGKGDDLSYMPEDLQIREFPS